MLKQVTENDIAFTRALRNLIGTIDQEHARIVLEDLASLRDPMDGPRFSNLTVAAILNAEQHIREGLPLALPPAVAQVYLDDLSAIAIHNCEDCGYEVPTGYGEPHGSAAKPVRTYFDRCLLCGGRTGYYAFY